MSAWSVRRRASQLGWFYFAALKLQPRSPSCSMYFLSPASPVIAPVWIWLVRFVDFCLYFWEPAMESLQIYLRPPRHFWIEGCFACCRSLQTLAHFYQFPISADLSVSGLLRRSCHDSHHPKVCIFQASEEAVAETFLRPEHRGPQNASQPNSLC